MNRNSDRSLAIYSISTWLHTARSRKIVINFPRTIFYMQIINHKFRSYLPAKIARFIWLVAAGRNRETNTGRTVFSSYCCSTRRHPPHIWEAPRSPVAVSRDLCCLFTPRIVTVWYIFPFHFWWHSISDNTPSRTVGRSWVPLFLQSSTGTKGTHCCRLGLYFAFHCFAPLFCDVLFRSDWLSVRLSVYIYGHRVIYILNFSKSVLLILYFYAEQGVCNNEHEKWPSTRLHMCRNIVELFPAGNSWWQKWFPAPFANKLVGIFNFTGSTGK